MPEEYGCPEWLRRNYPDPSPKKTKRKAALTSREVIEALALEVMDLRASLAHLRGVLVALGVTSLDGCDCPTCVALGGVR